MRIKTTIICLVTTGLFFWGGFARAGGPTKTTLEIITVTAQKQEENVQEVPMSISVMNETSIEDSMIESVGDISDHVPSLSLFNPGAAGIYEPSMRGVRAEYSMESVATGLYVDGVPVLDAYSYNDEMQDVERIEVLRGPQGTLYGKNTEAGVINIISKQPDNEFVGKVSGTIGEDDKHELSASVSGPLVKDKFYFGVSALFDEKDGFVENIEKGRVEDGGDKTYAKTILRWTPTEPLDISFIARYTDLDIDGVHMGLTEETEVAWGLPVTGDREVNTGKNNFREVTVDSQALKISYKIGESTELTSITTRLKLDTDNAQDWDLSSFDMMYSEFYREREFFTQELRLNSDMGGIKWLLGLYGDMWDTEQVKNVTKMGRITDTYIDMSGSSLGLFGHATVPFFIDGLSLSAGLRFDYEDKEYDRTDNGVEMKLDDTWSELSPKVSLDYCIDDNIMTYVSASKGYRSGGFNTHSGSTDEQTYDEEKLWSYEIGIKGSWFDNRLILSGAAYYMELDDMQVQEYLDPYTSSTTNVAKGSGEGFELEFTGKITSYLSLIGGFSYNNLEFDEFEDALGNYAGNSSPFAPEYTFNIGAQYRDATGHYARVDLIGYGKTYLDHQNDYSRDAYEIVNAKIGYEAEKLDVYLYAKNVFDKDYSTEGYFGGGYVVYSPPREVGMQLSYRF